MVTITATPKDKTDPVTVTYTKNNNGWTTLNKDDATKLGLPSTVPSKNTPMVEIPAKNVKGNTDVTVTVKDTDSANPDQTVNLLTVGFKIDTFGKGTSGTNKDNISRENIVEVNKLVIGKEWSYKIDNQDFISQGAATGTEGTFKLPKNTKIDGVAHTITVKIEDVAETTQVLTLDTKTKAPTLVADSSKSVTGIAESGALVEIVGGRNRVIGSVIANENGLYELTLPNDLLSGNSYKIRQTDKAGNVSQYNTFTYTSIPHIRLITKQNFWTSNNDTVTVGVGGNGNVWGIGTKVDAGKGNDSLYVKGRIYDSTNFDMGDGDDYLVSNHMYALRTGAINIDMGSGDDILQIKDSYLGSSARNVKINMGSGDDAVYVSTHIDGGASWLKGGSGDDKFAITNADGKTGEQDMSMLYSIETINLTGGRTNKNSNNPLETFNNSLKNVTLDSIIQNANGDGNKLEQALRIIGDKGDKVYLGSENKQDAVVQKDKNNSLWSIVDKVVEDNVTYNVWSNSSSKDPLHRVYIDQDITVI